MKRIIGIDSGLPCILAYRNGTPFQRQTSATQRTRHADCRQSSTTRRRAALGRLLRCGPGLPQIQAFSTNVKHAPSCRRTIVQPPSIHKQRHHRLGISEARKYKELRRDGVGHLHKLCALEPVTFGGVRRHHMRVASTTWSGLQRRRNRNL